MNIKRAPGHYEQKNPFILYKFYDLQSRIANLKSKENLKKEFKRDSVTVKIESYLFVAWVWNYFGQQSGFYDKSIRMAVSGIMKRKSNKSAMQNLLNRLEFWNCSTYAETKEYYEKLRVRNLPQKLQFWKGRKCGNITVSE